ncbi:MAG: sugar phosphate isomerase/epimerase [Candidatus Latescibacteria bacterium]|nr:sugar phosphate isomerase/epimerase [Candidatus Latescibacterota bacterium]
MKLSSVTFSFPLLPMDRAAAILKILGFEYVDITGYTKAPFEAITPWEIAQDPGGARAKIDSLRERHGLSPADYFFTFGEGFQDHCVNDPDPEVRQANLDVFRRVVPFCRDAGFLHITTLPGVIWDDIGPERSLELAAGTLNDLVSISLDAGIPMGIEPHWESVVESIDRTQRLVEMVDGLTLTLDYTHFVAQGIPQEEVDVLAQHTSHFHARQGAPGLLQTGMKDGTLDYRKIVQRLKDVGYDGFLTLEYSYQEWQECHRTDTIAETIRLAGLLRELL